MEPETPSRRDIALAAAGIAALAVAFIAVSIVGAHGDTLGWQFGDTPAAHLLWREWGFGWLRRGVLPLWNPHVFCGLPFAANPETALFYPLNWLTFLPLPAWLGIDFSVLLHLWLGGLGCWVAAGAMRLRPASRWTAAAIWMFSGQTLGRLYAGHQNILDSSAWFPWLLVGIMALFSATHPRAMARPAAIIAIATGMMGLAGHPQIFLYAGILVAVYTVMALCSTLAVERNPRCSLWRVAWAAAGAASGVAIAAMQLLITTLAAKESTREQLTTAAAGTFSLPLSNWVTALMPNFFGNGASSPYWGPWYRWETAISVGILGLLLIVSGIVYTLENSGRRALGLPLVVTLGFAMLVALGTATPLFPLMRHLIPTFDLFRGPAKILVPATTLAALLGAFGCEIILAPSAAATRRRVIVPAVVAAIALLAGGVSVYTIESSPGAYAAWLRASAAMGANMEWNPDVYTREVVMKAALGNVLHAWWFFATQAVLALGIIFIAWRWRGTRWAPVLVVAALTTNLWVDHHGFVTLFDSTKIHVKVNIADVDRHLYRVFVTDPAVSPSVALRDDFLAVNGYESLQPRLYMQLMNAINGLPAEHYEALPEPRDLVRLQQFHTATRWVLDAEGMHELPGYSPRFIIDSKVPGATCTLISETPNEIHLSIQCPADGQLRIADTWAPGWRAWQNGAEREILHDDIAFRRIPFTAPGGDVVLRYRAPGLITGGIISLLGLLATLGMALAGRGDFGSGGSQKSKPESIPASE